MSYLTVNHNPIALRAKTVIIIISPVIGVMQINKMDLKERVLLSIPTTELYYITGGGAPISRQSKKYRQKHGGFSRLLMPNGSSGLWQLPLTNHDPISIQQRSSPACYLHKYFMFSRQNHAVFLWLWIQKFAIRNNYKGRMFLLTCKIRETFKVFYLFTPLFLDWQSQGPRWV